MSQPSIKPHLSPQYCFSTQNLKDFLRLSRSSIDDSISQNLNALVTPARAGFDPASTRQRSYGARTNLIDRQSCTDFKDRVLFPSWQARSDLLNYCALVSTSPDPDDPEAAARELENQRGRDRVVDERSDPYSGRYFPRQARTERLATLVRQEEEVESIVRHRTWEVIQQRCGGSSECGDAGAALKDWHVRKGSA